MRNILDYLITELSAINLQSYNNAKDASNVIELSELIGLLRAATEKSAFDIKASVREALLQLHRLTLRTYKPWFGDPTPTPLAQAINTTFLTATRMFTQYNSEHQSDVEIIAPAAARAAAASAENLTTQMAEIIEARLQAASAEAERKRTEELEAFKREQATASAEAERRRTEELEAFKREQATATAEAERKRTEELEALRGQQTVATAAIVRLESDNAAKESQLVLVTQTAEERSRALAVAEERQLMLTQQGGDIVKTLLTQLALSGAIKQNDPTAQAAIQLFKVNVEFNQAPAAAEPANPFDALPDEFYCSKSLENRNGLIENQSNREYSRRMLYQVTSDLRFLAIEMLVKYFDYVLMAMHFQNPDMFTGATLADVQERIKFYTEDKHKFNNTYPPKSVDELKQEVAPFIQELNGSSKEELTELIKRLCFYIFRETEKTWVGMSSDTHNPVQSILSDASPKLSELKHTIRKLVNLGKNYSDSMGRPESLAAKLEQTKDEQLTDPQKVHKVAALYQGTLFACHEEERDVLRAYMPQDDALAEEGQERFEAAKPMSPTALYAPRLVR